MPADGVEPDIDEAECRWLGALPTCAGCGALLRPNLLMFGDWDWIPTRYEAQETRLARWLSRAERPVVVEIGAGSNIPSVRHFSQHVVAHRGGQIVRISPREPDVAASLGRLPAGAVRRRAQHGGRQRLRLLYAGARVGRGAADAGRPADAVGRGHKP